MSLSLTLARGGISPPKPPLLPRSTNQTIPLLMPLVVTQLPKSVPLLQYWLIKMLLRCVALSLTNW